jgi:hypothetical protein
MQPMKSDKTESNKTDIATRRAWRPPVLSKLPIGIETKSARQKPQDMRQDMGSQTAGAGRASHDHPQPPTAPATKLGFAMEWAFPLSARWQG